jgi:hypothetical protein
MKKVRLSLKRGTQKWTFILYDSAEAAFYLKNGIKEKSDYYQDIDLKYGSFMEAEWLGSEYVYTDVTNSDGYESYDYVRLAKFVKGTRTNPRDYVEIANGWIVGGSIPWSEDCQSSLKIIRLNEKRKHRFDFSVLFKTMPMEEPPGYSEGYLINSSPN